MWERECLLVDNSAIERKDKKEKIKEVDFFV
jgi:hypothetical protein